MQVRAEQTADQASDVTSVHGSLCGGIEGLDIEPGKQFEDWLRDK